MISGEKILITGGQGPSGAPVVGATAADNDVYVMARFGNPAARETVERLGGRCLVHDLTDSFDAIPDDFSYVYHSSIPGATRLSPFDLNADAAGRLLAHCRTAKGFVFVSSASVYQTTGDDTPLLETTPFGVHTKNIQSGSFYPFSKVAAEAVVTFVARQTGIRVTILRMASPYGPAGGTVMERLDRIVRGQPILLHPGKPNFFRPMYETDVGRLAVAAMGRGQVPPLVVNFCGDETVSAEEYCAYLGSLVGCDPIIQYSEAGTYDSLVPDTTLMHEVLGRCEVGWREGCRRVVQARYPELLRSTDTET
jgi:nucleoside-diphosphate-sugar epimerase